jgi:hypothetical protein
MGPTGRRLRRSVGPPCRRSEPTPAVCVRVRAFVNNRSQISPTHWSCVSIQITPAGVCACACVRVWGTNERRFTTAGHSSCRSRTPAGVRVRACMGKRSQIWRPGWSFQLSILINTGACACVRVRACVQNQQVTDGHVWSPCRSISTTGRLCKTVRACVRVAGKRTVADGDHRLASWCRRS